MRSPSSATALLVDGIPAEGLGAAWALPGASIFTTVRVERGGPIHWEAHLARLARTAAALGFSYPGDPAWERDLAAIEGAGERLLCRLTLTEGPRLMAARPFVDPPARLYEEGAPVVQTRWQIHPSLARYKTGSYLPFHLARREAEARGAFEGLLLDADGCVVDGSRTSPLLLQGEERLILLEGGLEGITREAVAAEAARMGLAVERRRLTAEELEGELLLAGSGVGLLPTRPPSRIAASLIARFRPG